MKKIVIINLTFFLVFSLYLVGKLEDKSIVTAEPTTKPDANKTNVTDLIRPLLTNVATLGKYTFKVAANFKEIKSSAQKLKPDIACLANVNSAKCKELHCSSLSRCAGTTLSDLLKVIYPFLEAILGSVEADGTTIKPGSLFALVDTAEKIPSAIPASLYTKLKADTYKSKVDGMVVKLGQFRDKLPLLTKNFNDAMAMLNGIVLFLNPEMLVDTMPIKPLPPVNLLEGSESLTENIVKDIAMLS